MGTEPPLGIRPLEAGEHELLLTASLGNFNWAEPLFTRDDVMVRPDLARYTEIVPSRGDFGLVAECEAQSVAVAWALYLPAEEPGYGWVDPTIPEFCVWVAPDLRGRGIGRMLVGRLLDEARARGVRRVSLSVDARNVRAKWLYLALGFVPIPGGELYGVLLWSDPAST